MQINIVSFTGKKPASFPSPKAREAQEAKQAKGWSSDDIGILQYNMLIKARQKIREVQSQKIVELSNAKTDEDKARIKAEIRKTLEKAICSIDKALGSSTIKFYY